MDLVLICHDCVAKYESNDRACLGHPGDAAFPVSKDDPAPMVCPRCRSESVTVVVRASPPQVKP